VGDEADLSTLYWTSQCNMDTIIMMENMLRLLWRDDTNIDHALIDFNNTDISNEEWSEALSRTSHVKAISFIFDDGASGRNLDSLLGIISTRNILEKSFCSGRQVVHQKWSLDSFNPSC
jgi:hypothetical protein